MEQLALASRLHINWRKSSLVSCTERDLETLGRQGSVVRKVSDFLTLGVSIGNECYN